MPDEEWAGLPQDKFILFTSLTPDRKTPLGNEKWSSLSPIFRGSQLTLTYLRGQCQEIKKVVATKEGILQIEDKVEAAQQSKKKSKVSKHEPNIQELWGLIKRQNIRYMGQLGGGGICL